MYQLSKHPQRLLSSLAALLLLSLSSAAQASDCAAEPLVKEIAQSFEHAARSHSSQAFASAASRYADMHSLAIFALGSYRSKLTPGDEARYVYLARGFLGRWMAENSTRISGSGISIQACSEQVVSARFGDGTSVVFHLIGPSRVADISVSGISLAGVLRGKITDVLRGNGGSIPGLMDYLAQ